MTDRDVDRLDRSIAALTVAVNAMQVSIGAIGVNVEHIHDHEERIRALEEAGFKLSGVWQAVGLAGAAIAGVAGLIIGALAYFFN